jgi:hypothetical protein
MAAPLFIAWNADTSALTGPPAVTATSAVSGTVKTILQVKPGAGKLRIVEWGYSFDAAPSTAVRVELIETGTVFATVTTIGSGIRAYNDATGPASACVAGTSATGFNATAEGTVTASRLFAYNYDNAVYFKQQFPLGREPEVNAASSLRIRATPTSAAAVNIFCYVIWEE